MEDAENPLYARVSKRLLAIKEYIDEEYLNLKLNNKRPRTRNGILTKTNLLKDNLKEYENLLEEYENLFPTQAWNSFTDSLDIIKNKIKLSIQILNYTTVLPNSGKPRDRKFSEDFLEASDLEKGFFRIDEDFPLSSTLEENSINKESNLSGFLEQSNKIKAETSEIVATIEAKESQLSNSSAELFKIIKQALITKKSKMTNAAYEFPMVTAIQCIPEFHGKHEELDPFLMQIKYFADKIPEGEIHDPLLYVVYTKLKGKALLRLSQIKGDTWPEVKEKLENEFDSKRKIGSLIKEIETLSQGRNEPFEKYRARAEEMYEWVDSLHNEGEESYAKATLRRHFLGGLQDSELAQAGKSQRDISFPKLLTWIQKENEEAEELRDINSRLQECNWGQKNCNNRSTNNTSASRNFENRNNNRQNFRNQNQNDQRPQNNGGRYQQNFNSQRRNDNTWRNRPGNNYSNQNNNISQMNTHNSRQWGNNRNFNPNRNQRQDQQWYDRSNYSINNPNHHQGQANPWHDRQNNQNYMQPQNHQWYNRPSNSNNGHNLNRSGKN